MNKDLMIKIDELQQKLKLKWVFYLNKILFVFKQKINYFSFRHMYPVIHQIKEMMKQIVQRKPVLKNNSYSQLYYLFFLLYFLCDNFLNKAQKNHQHIIQFKLEMPLLLPWYLQYLGYVTLQLLFSLSCMNQQVNQFIGQSVCQTNAIVYILMCCFKTEVISLFESNISQKEKINFTHKIVFSLFIVDRIRTYMSNMTLIVRVNIKNNKK